MSYTVYTTPSVVLNSWNRGEDNVAFDLFTEDLGRVMTEARGITKLSSKLRFALQIYSMANVSLVHGKSGWRLINAEPRANFYYDAEATKKDVLIEFIEFIRRLMPFEERYSEVFENIQNIYRYRQVGENERLVLIGNLLWRLGYLPPDEVYTRVLDGDHIELKPSETKKINGAITKALHNTQL